MTQKELAALLGVSGAMVSRLAKRGMPTDSLERAQRWRKRHLEPGRIKGARFDPTTPAQPVHAGVSVAPGARPPAAKVPVSEVEAAALFLGGLLGAPALTDICADLLAELRELLRGLASEALPCMPLGVWLALVDYVLDDDSPARHSPDSGAFLSPQAFGLMASPNYPGMVGEWLHIARDWYGSSLKGGPVDPDDTEDSD